MVLLQNTWGIAWRFHKLKKKKTKNQTELNRNFRFGSVRKIFLTVRFGSIFQKNRTQPLTPLPEDRPTTLRPPTSSSSSSTSEQLARSRDHGDYLASVHQRTHQDKHPLLAVAIDLDHHLPTSYSMDSGLAMPALAPSSIVS